ncbi:hypothetical protein BD410DRAFT_802995 [Rickenella mellea]|uniref:Uncharacterized protein n=1 Tax=Rickenella mellea TaxID=50990 RepID=A0A4Y7Q7X9_9AGAM|nr:hypothetical protein BD410DRAFT_802995 [Rickenella mellea]
MKIFAALSFAVMLTGGLAQSLTASHVWSGIKNAIDASTTLQRRVEGISEDNVISTGHELDNYGAAQGLASIASAVGRPTGVLNMAHSGSVAGEVIEETFDDPDVAKIAPVLQNAGVNIVDI